MAILFAGLFAFISACLIIVNEYLDFKKEIKIIEEGYIQAQQKKCRNTTQSSLQYHRISLQTEPKSSERAGLSKA